ncbi:MAG: hypothetical protein HQK54_13075 [Oligoflexales bacterium]|nr:hypothetical protein [Oligoflexales bacterium]
MKLSQEEREVVQTAYSTLEKRIYWDLKDLILESVNSVGDLAGDLGKAVPQILIKDHGYKLHINLQASLKNAFIHLFRNSLDHGIEAADERIKKNKKENGSIFIEMEMGDSFLTLKYHDDGRGINLAKLRQLGTEKGLLPPECPDLQEICRLIFSDGISTKDDVSEISGLGVGMSAVKAHLEENGCQIRTILLTNDNSSGFLPFEFHLLFPKKLVRRFQD